MAVEYFAGASDKATKSADQLSEAEKRLQQATERAAELRQQEEDSLKNSRAQLELYTAKVKNFTGTKSEEARLVNELNNTYGTTLGYYKTAAEWYNTLTKNSKKYCDQLILEAKIRTLVNEIADLENQRDNEKYDSNGKIKQSWLAPTETVFSDGTARDNLGNIIPLGTPYQKQVDHTVDFLKGEWINPLEVGLNQLRGKLDEYVKQLGQIKYDLTPSTANPQVNPTATPDSIKAKTAEYNADASDLQGYYDNIAALQERLRTATIEQAVEINKEIALWREKARAIEDAGKVEEQATERVYDANASTLRGIEDNIAIQQERLKDATKEDAVFINRSIALWKEKADEIRNAGVEIAEAVEEENEAVAESNRNILGGFQGVYGGVRGVADSVTRLTSALDDNASAWEKIITSIDTVFSLINGVGSVMSALTMFRDTSKEIAAAKTTEAVATGMATAAGAAQATEAVAQVTALAGIGTAANATANAEMQLAGATTLAAHAYIPFAGVGIASGLIMSGLSLVQNLHPFAKGGIISGPTLGLLGEYAGAPNNPEVVAPLDKLRSLLPSTGGGVMTAKVRGRDLVLATSNETRASSRSGRRSNIRL